MLRLLCYEIPFDSFILLPGYQVSTQATAIIWLGCRFSWMMVGSTVGSTLRKGSISIRALWSWLWCFFRSILPLFLALSHNFLLSVTLSFLYQGLKLILVCLSKMTEVWCCRELWGLLRWLASKCPKFLSQFKFVKGAKEISFKVVLFFP